jgi:hypothetical protein
VRTRNIIDSIPHSQASPGNAAACSKRLSTRRNLPIPAVEPPFLDAAQCVLCVAVHQEGLPPREGNPPERPRKAVEAADILFHLLPWEYSVRNLFRRALRSALTLFGLTLVVFLVFVVVGFIRGLEGSLAVSGDRRVVLVHSLGSSENLENSSVPNQTPALLSASLGGIQRWQRVAYTSPELYLGTLVTVKNSDPAFGLVRGVTPSAPLVRRQVQILEGHWPGPGEVQVDVVFAGILAPRWLEIGSRIPGQTGLKGPLEASASRGPQACQARVGAGGATQARWGRAATAEGGTAHSSTTAPRQKTFYDRGAFGTRRVRECWQVRHPEDAHGCAWTSPTQA